VKHSVLGDLAKRLAEMLALSVSEGIVQDAAKQSGRSFVSVRFGNVWQMAYGG
jgi:FlaA1/EpsC-like NDP-sugar epimerase